MFTSGKNEYPTAPIMAILLKPFASLPPMTGRARMVLREGVAGGDVSAWVFGLVQSTHPSASLPWRGEIRTGGPRSFFQFPEALFLPLPAGGGFRQDLARAATIILCLPALLGDLSHNNVNIFILFLVVGCLEAYRRRLDTLAGLTLAALSIACKVTPLLFLAYFVWKRSWRVVFATLVGLVLWLAIVPSATFGWERNRDLLGDWYSLMVERPMLKGEITTEGAEPIR